MQRGIKRKPNRECLVASDLYQMASRYTGCALTCMNCDAVGPLSDLCLAAPSASAHGPSRPTVTAQLCEDCVFCYQQSQIRKMAKIPQRSFDPMDIDSMGEEERKSTFASRPRPKRIARANEEHVFRPLGVPDCPSNIGQVYKRAISPAQIVPLLVDMVRMAKDTAELCAAYHSDLTAVRVANMTVSVSPKDCRILDLLRDVKNPGRLGFELHNSYSLWPNVSSGDGVRPWFLRRGSHPPEIFDPIRTDQVASIRGARILKIETNVALRKGEVGARLKLWMGPRNGPIDPADVRFVIANTVWIGMPGVTLSVRACYDR